MDKIAKLVSIVIVTRNRKKELIKCLQSLQSSNYKEFEVVVVDNATHPPVSYWLKKNLKNVKIIRSDKNIGAAGGRNLGTKYTNGEYLLFIDDDAMADKNMINELIAMFNQYQNVGIVQPKIYDLKYKNVFQGIGCNINLLTGRVSAIGIREKDYGQYDSLKEISSVGCIWMVKRRVIEQAGGYDEEYFIPYEDLDFSFRVKSLGYKILFAAKALAWHKGVKSTFMNPLLDYIGIRSPDRAYRIARNKMIFMRKHSPWPKNIFFFFFFLPIYTVIHSLIIIISWRLDILYQYWLGVFSGLWYSLGYFDEN